MKKKKKNSPLQINTALIESYKGVNKYTRTGGGTRRVEWSPEMVDAAFKPAARAVKEGQASAYLGDKEKQENQTTDADRIKSLEAQIAKLQQDQNQEPKPKPQPDDESKDGKLTLKPNPPIQRDIQKEKDEIKKQVEEEFNQYPDDSSSEEKAVEKEKAQRIKVRAGTNNPLNEGQMVEVNGQEMSIDEFNQRYPADTLQRTTPQRVRRTGDMAGQPYEGAAGLAGDYNVSLDSSPVKMIGRSPIQKTDYDPIQDLQFQNPNIEKDVDNYIANMNIIGDEKLDILGAQANSRVFNYSKQLKDQANMYIDQEGNNKIVNDSINTLKGLAKSVNNLIDKKSEWVENNGGAESTKRQFSAGSSGKNKFMQNAIFMERDDLYKMILPLPEVTVGGDTKFDDIEFAFGDFSKSDKPNAVVKSKEIFKDVFMKPEAKFAEFRKAANKMAEESKLRKPYNDYHASVIADSLLDSKENVLAFAWDNFAGPSFIEQYREANPNEDISWADVDSRNFQENKLKDEVAYWLKRKLKSEHDMAKATEEAFAEAGQMTAQQLLKKYSL